MNIDTTKLDNILNNFLAPFECSAMLGEDFAYWISDNTITYALLISDQHEDTFLKFVKELFPEIHADIFLWSLLHELGHNETNDDFDDKDHQEYRNFINRQDITDEEYYSCPIELAATLWAGEYIQNHIDEIARLWEQIAAAIQEIYVACKIK